MEFSKRELRNFELARQASYFSDFPRIKMGSVVVKGNKILNHAANTSKTHPSQRLLNRYRSFDGDCDCWKNTGRLHAEVNVLLPFNKFDDLSKAKIYVYRRSGDGTGLSRPCPACMTRIKELGIHRVFFTTPYGFAFENVK